MGGTRSGRWRDQPTRPVAEATPRLPLDGVLRRHLKQQLAFGPETPPHMLNVSPLGWTGGACAIAIVYHPERAPQMKLTYRYENEPRSQLVPFDWLAAPLGGRRAYWRCPACNRRCGALFFLDAAWCCRVCGNLTYRSSNESDTRVRQLLASPDLSAALAELLANPDASTLALAQKTLELIAKRTRREARQRYGRRGLPRDISAPASVRQTGTPAGQARPSKR